MFIGLDQSILHGFSIIRGETIFRLITDEPCVYNGNASSCAKEVHIMTAGSFNYSQPFFALPYYFSQKRHRSPVEYISSDCYGHSVFDEVYAFFKFHYL
jgi:hypothetical protein